MAPATTQAEALPHEGWALTAHAPSRGTQPVDLLFVHGMAAGGWIWGEAFLAPFRDAGFACWTVTLPGPAPLPALPALPDQVEIRLDPTDPAAALAGLAEVAGATRAALVQRAGPGLAPLAEALAQALAATGRPTVLVCHSLGGALGQALLRQGRGGAGLVLLCSVPPYGLWRASAEMALTAPDLWLALTRFALAGLDPADMEVMRRGLFPAGIAPAAFDRFAAQLRDESLAAMVQCLGLPPFAPLPGPRRDVIVAGARADRLVPATDVLATAAWYGVAPLMLDAEGHLPMVGPAAPRVGAALAARLAARAPDWAAGA